MEELLLKNKLLEEENRTLREQLHKYSHSQKEYYAKNKEMINARSVERLKKLAEEDPEKIKEYRKNAYLKRKAKLLTSL